MCTMAILYRVARGTPILVAANREERFDRPTQYPKIQSGTPRVVCGIDRQAGGTWLGVNQYGLFCAVANRPKQCVPPEPRSRGLLCRDLLDLRTAKEAAAHAAKELGTGAYAGANYVCADARYAAVVHGGNKVEIVELSPGLHVVTSGNVDDPRDERHEFVRRMLTLHTLDSAVTFLAVASRVFRRQAGQRGPPRRGASAAASSAPSRRRCSRCRGRSSRPSISMRPVRPATAPTTTSPRCCGRCSRPNAAERAAKATVTSPIITRCRTRNPQTGQAKHKVGAAIAA